MNRILSTSLILLITLFLCATASGSVKGDLKKAGFSKPEIKVYRNLKDTSDMPVVQQALKYKELGFTLEQVETWEQISGKNTSWPKVIRANDFSNDGLTPAESIEWFLAEFMPSVVCTANSCVSEEDELTAFAWREAGVDSELAKRMLELRLTPSEYQSLANAGYKPDADLVKRISTLNMRVSDIIALWSAGFDDNLINNWQPFFKKARNCFEINCEQKYTVERGISWHQAGYKPDDARDLETKDIDLATRKMLSKYCKDQFSMESIFDENPYDINGNCFVVIGRVTNSLDQRSVLFERENKMAAKLLASEFGVDSSHLDQQVKAVFEDEPTPRRGKVFKAIAKGSNAYEYKSGRGIKSVIPSVKIVKTLDWE